MKYKAGQLKNGKWAVLTGNKHFISTITDDKAEAESKAAEMSAIWYMEQAEKAMMKITKAEGLYKVAFWGEDIARRRTLERLEQIGVEVSETDPYGYLA